MHTMSQTLINLITSYVCSHSSEISSVVQEQECNRLLENCFPWWPQWMVCSMRISWNPSVCPTANSNYFIYIYTHTYLLHILARFKKISHTQNVTRKSEMLSNVLLAYCLFHPKMCKEVSSTRQTLHALIQPRFPISYFWKQCLVHKHWKNAS